MVILALSRFYVDLRLIEVSRWIPFILFCQVICYMLLFVLLLYGKRLGNTNKWVIVALVETILPPTRE